MLVTRASTRQHKKIVISGTIAAFRSTTRVADMAVLSPGAVMKSSGQRPPTENTVSSDTVLFLYTGFMLKCIWYALQNSTLVTVQR